MKKKEIRPKLVRHWRTLGSANAYVVPLPPLWPIHTARGRERDRDRDGYNRRQWLPAPVPVPV